MEGTKITVPSDILNTEESWLIAQLFREEKMVLRLKYGPYNIIHNTGMKGGIVGTCCTLLAFQMPCHRGLQ